MDFGYKRVSTTEQSTARQLVGVKLDKVFEDKISGSVKSRPQLDALLDQIRSGDTIHVHSVDRIARSLQHLLELIESMTTAGVTLQFHKESMTFTGDDSAMQRLQLQLMGSLAEFEKSLIIERTAEGRAIAMQKGVKFGRKATLSAKQVAQIKLERENGKKVAAIALDYNVSRQSVYRALESVDG